MSRIVITRGLVPLRSAVHPLRTMPVRAATLNPTFSMPLQPRSMLGSVTHFSHFPALYQRQPLEKTPTNKLDQSAVAKTTGEKAVGEDTNKAEKEPSKIVKMLKEAKKMMNFYKDGIKLLWANNKTAKSLKEKVEKEGHVLSRDEYQLIKISEKDMIKLIPFAAIFMILAESVNLNRQNQNDVVQALTLMPMPMPMQIPFIVMFAPSLVPSTCVTPSQIQKQRAKMYKKRLEMSQNVVQSGSKVEGISVNDFLSHANVCRLAKRYEMDFQLANIDRKHLSAYCRFMGLSSWGTHGMLRKRLDKHFDYVVRDDKYIADEGVEQLEINELEQAAEERGMRSVDVSPEQLRKSIQYWINLSLKQDPVIPRGLLVFSRMYLLNANYDKK